MRYLSIILFVTLILSVCFCFAPCARAEEVETDWENYDWVNFSVQGLDDSTWESMCKWFRTDAELSLLFFVAGRTDGYFSTDIAYSMSIRFLSEPENVLYALAKENKDVWQHCSRLIVFETYEHKTMIDLLENITLSGPDAEKGYEILAYMIDYAEEEYNTDITNPKTGDPVGAAVILLALSSIFCAFLVLKKNMFGLLH